MIEFYTDKRGKHRWRIKGENGEIIDASSQGYASEQMCKNNLRLSFEAKQKYFKLS